MGPVSGIVLVILFTGVTGYLTEQVLSTNPSLNAPPLLGNISIPLLSRIPIVGPALFGQNIFFYLAVGIIIVLEILIGWTALGLRIRAAGENPAAAESAGINVRRLRYCSTTASGLIAGIGGAYFSIGSAGQFVEGMSSGLRYVALAAVILGSWRTSYAAAAALMFGFASSISTAFGLLKVNLSPSLLLMIPYIVTIIVVASVSGAGRAPAAAGVKLVD